MKTGDIVWMRCNGRVYFAQVEFVTECSAHVRFVTRVPQLEGKRRRRRAFGLSKFREQEIAGARWQVAGVDKRGDD